MASYKKELEEIKEHYRHTKLPSLLIQKSGRKDTLSISKHSGTSAGYENKWQYIKVPNKEVEDLIMNLAKNNDLLKKLLFIQDYK